MKKKRAYYYTRDYVGGDRNFTVSFIEKKTTKKTVMVKNSHIMALMKLNRFRDVDSHNFSYKSDFPNNYSSLLNVYKIYLYQNIEYFM